MNYNKIYLILLLFFISIYFILYSNNLKHTSTSTSSSFSSSFRTLTSSNSNSNSTLSSISSSPTISSSISLSKHLLRSLIEWGGAFNSGATSNGIFPEFKCNYLDKQMCCSALQNVTKKPIQRHLKHCQIKKQYISSPYELKQFEKAEELTKITDKRQRTVAFIEFIESKEQMDHAKKWLERVALRQPGKHIQENEDDKEYLSRFRVTRHCPGESPETWYEYIEPLTVHARHPFGLHECWHPHHRDKIEVYHGDSPKVSLLSVDFILLQSLSDIYGTTNSTSLRPPHSPHLSPTTYIFDGGSSRFDTSMYWFVCAYEQLGFIIDNLFGWEYTLLEPLNFWKYVPPKYTGIYHFFNAPISADKEEIHSPLRLIKQLATPEDFVSFKLDIDTPSVEIPIALDILNSTDIHQLLDEFFFELHFQCDVLMDCGWGYDIPESFQGQNLDRASALKLFKDIRHAGIRAHFWP